MTDADKNDDENTSSAGESLWQRLVRHGVVQAASAYLVVGWLIIQVAEATFDDIGMPAWSTSFVIFTVIGGFPVAVVLAWFLEKRNGRIVMDDGSEAGGLFGGLERNYPAVVIAYIVAAAGAGVYQYMTGFEAEAVDLIPVAPNSIAVLRLDNVDGSERTQVFADALSDDLIDQLARVPGLLVSARGDSWSLAEGERDSATVRRRLRVAHYVEGSVYMENDAMSVVIRLVRSDGGFQVLSRNFERPVGAYLGMRRDIASLVIDNLRPALANTDLELQPGDYEDQDPGAYELFRRGKSIVKDPRSLAQLDNAISLFEQALELDEGYPPAYAGICKALVTKYQNLLDDRYMAEAERACTEARMAGEKTNIVQSALGEFYSVKGDFDSAEKAFGRALEMNDRDVNSMRGLADVYRKTDRYDQAEELLKQAIELQPGNWRNINFLGNMKFSQGDYEEAIDIYKRVLFLNPEDVRTLGNMAAAMLMTGDFAGSAETSQKAVDLHPISSFYSNLGMAYYYLGDFSLAAGNHAETVRLTPEADFGWANLADALYHAGSTDEAMGAYERAAELSRGRLAVNQEDVEALYTLAWSEAMLGHKESADFHIQRVIDLNFGGPYPYYYYAIIKLRSGETKAAERAMERALELGFSPRMAAAEPHLAALRDSQRLAYVFKNEE